MSVFYITSYFYSCFTVLLLLTWSALVIGHCNALWQHSIATLLWLYYVNVCALILQNTAILQVILHFFFAPLNPTIIFIYLHYILQHFFIALCLHLFCDKNFCFIITHHLVIYNFVQFSILLFLSTRNPTLWANQATTVRATMMLYRIFHMKVLLIFYNSFEKKVIDPKL